MESSTHLHNAYERVANFDEVAGNAQLRFLEWKIVFALDGLMTGTDVALAFGLTEDRTNAIFHRLLEKGIVTELEISLGDFKERTKPREPEPTAHRPSGFPGNGSAELSAVTSLGEVPAYTPRTTATAGVSGAISFSLRKRFRLKAALDFIQAHAGGGTLGQLAVYRTFMLIPGDLLKEMGLHRLDFNDDSVEISNPKLRKAIIDAIGKTLRINVPSGAFLE